MAINYSKWINFAIATVVVLALFVFTFTSSASAATSTNISSITSTSQYVGINGDFLTITLPDDSAFIMKSILSAGSGINGSLVVSIRPNQSDTYLGKLLLSLDDLLSICDGFYIKLAINDSITNGLPSYGNSYEYCYIPLSFFSSNTSLFNTSSYIYNASNYYGFVISNILNFSFSNGNNFAYSGSYESVKNSYGNNAYYGYIFQTLKYYINSAPYLLDSFVSSSDSLKIMSYTAEGFANLNTDEYKLLKQTIQNIVSDSMSGVQDQLDDIYNSGSGQFDDTKDQMQDASDKAEQGNQDIQNNAPKPDINNTVGDTSDVIDGALSGESFDKVSDLLSAIFANTLISTILLISVAVGAVKYIFFGKG